MAMTPAQMAAELQRKKNAGIAPTSQANTAAYSKLTAQPGAVKTTANTATSSNPMGTTPAASPPVGQQFIRDYLKSKNIGDNSIGYANGQVTLNGAGFITPGANQNGKTTASTFDLDQAFNSWKLNQGTQKTDELLKKYESMITPYKEYEAAAPWEYVAQNDPAYQTALQSALANAQTAQNNAMASLGARGIGNSSSAITAANQIQQNAYGSVSRDVLPLLMQQDYQRYRDTENDRYKQWFDQYNIDHNRVADIGSLLGYTQDNNQFLSDQNQNAITNKYNNDYFGWQKDTQAQEFNRLVGRDKVADSQWQAEMDYTKDQDKIDQDNWMKEFNEKVKQNGISNALQWAQESRMASNAASDNALAREKFDYEKSQDSTKKQNEEKAKMSDEKNAMMDALRYGSISKNTARSQIQKDYSEGYYTVEQAKEMLAALDQFADPSPTLTQPTANPFANVTNRIGLPPRP